MSDGFFGDMFDFNGDGELGFVERAAELAFVSDLLTEAEKEEKLEELEAEGLDPDELEMMDEDERREAIEDAGLDPDDFDFD
ncbi:MAG: hypothetical protein ACI4KL_01520 [Lentihominibacter sp.]